MNDFLDTEIKKRVERLLFWFIPVFLISTVGTFLDAKTVDTLSAAMLTNPESSKQNLTNLMLLYRGLSGLDNFVVAVWLFFQARHFNFNKFIWPVFSLIQPYFAMLSFLLVLFIQRSDRSSSNHLMQRMEQ